MTLLRDCWYLALLGRRLKRGRMVAKTLLGEPVVIGRRADGEIFALRNICPHRGMPLHHGQIEDGGVRCCYHGWKFSTEDGRCIDIPSLTADQTFHLERVRVTLYPCREVQGNIWIYIPRNGTRRETPADLPPVPHLPDIGERGPRFALSMDFACDIDQAVVGLMDPTHLGYVHTSWWWHKRNRQPRLKEKSYVPFGTGFRLERHELKSGARPYRILGKNVSTEITFQLPAVRVEHIKGDRHSVVSLTAITPLTDTTSEVHQCMYWTIRGLGLLSPIMQRLARTFLGQDREVVIRQAAGLAYDPPLMLIDDADTQAKWYYRLKQRQLECQEQGKPFQSPLKPRILRYRS